MIDEIKAIEKSVSGLKTIQNRLKKILKERNWAISTEIPRLEGVIENLQRDLDSANEKIRSKENLIDDLLAKLEERDDRIAMLDIDSNSEDNTQVKTKKRTSKKNDNIIKLPEGYVKFRENGKWGIKNKKGKIIVECIFDEIGSYNSRFIGFIDGEIVILKQAPRFFYNVPIWGIYKYTSKTRDVFEIAGVNCSILSPTPDRIYEVGKKYQLIIDKISKNLTDIKAYEVTQENTSRIITSV